MGNTLLPQPIDALSGRELDAAVAIELGWRFMGRPNRSYVVAIEPESVGQHLLDGWVYRDTETDHTLRIPRYSTDIAAAWTLDGDGWEWSFDECGDILGCRQHKLDATVFLSRECWYQADVHFADFPSKAHAYATARCRAWLKARLATPKNTVSK